MKALNDELQMRSDWLMPICAGGERVKDEGAARRIPTQKPEALLYRVLLASTNQGDVVLDPFFGTGTTGAVARRLGRHWVGIEREKRYVAACPRADRSTPSRSTKARCGAGAKSAPSRAFRSAPWSTAASAPGAILDRFEGRTTARGPRRRLDRARRRRRLDPQDRRRGPGPPACNGWTFWHYREDGKLRVIDELRTVLRRELAAAG